ncbi:hypothetical protein CDV55_107748 [Aspergillus turcosus]|nr:hypothetical protein CDV55_107748 [Aspergillus turcosus]
MGAPPTPAESQEHQQLLNRLDIAHVPRPFRNPNWRPSQRRNKNVKQLISENTRKEASVMATQANSGASTPLQPSTDGSQTPFESSARTNIAQAAQNLSTLVLEKNARAMLPSGPAVTYTNIESAPSLHPSQHTRYCDITGLPAPYTDPKTRLRYHDKETEGEAERFEYNNSDSSLNSRRDTEPASCSPKGLPTADRPDPDPAPLTTRSVNRTNPLHLYSRTLSLNSLSRLTWDSYTRATSFVNLSYSVQYSPRFTWPTLKMPTMWLSDNQKIGVIFCSAGGLFLFGGVLMFFDRSLLAMGNVLFLIGLTLIIGFQRTFAFFSRRQKLKGTAAFAAGILLILFRWPLTGFLIELYGLFILFGDFLVTIGQFAGNIPVVGPYIKTALETLAGGRRNAELPV